MSELDKIDQEIELLKKKKELEELKKGTRTDKAISELNQVGWLMFGIVAILAIYYLWTVIVLGNTPFPFDRIP